MHIIAEALFTIGISFAGTILGWEYLSKKEPVLKDLYSYRVGVFTGAFILFAVAIADKLIGG